MNGVKILEGLHATSKEVLKTWETGLIDEVGHEPPTSELSLSTEMHC